MIALVIATLVSALAGSLHCAAMCGPLAAAAGAQRWYAVGRLLGYLALGVVAGAVGAVVDLAGELASLGGIAMVAAGVALVGYGGWSLARALRRRPAASTVGDPRPMVYAIGRRRPATRGLLVGLLTAALPCGWLYVFVVIAAGTGDPLGGAAVMAALWLGSLPALLGAGVVLRVLARRLGRRLPVITAALQIAVGVVALAVRVPLLDRPLPAAGASPAEVHPSCH